MAIEMDDDVFFADLSKQIALLIMDDDDEFPVQTPWPPLHLQGYHHFPESIVPPPYTNEIMAYRRGTSSKGTGVFIPRSSSLPRRKNRSGKSTSNNSNSQRQSNKSEVAVPHVANSSRLHSNCYANSGATR